ncbi:hypothetical protein E4T56_gene11999 [Termitomyces sp. T112]|nr:hypothetical protein E4T56_gene11999 [Termitomyces sp. T112]
MLQRYNRLRAQEDQSKKAPTPPPPPTPPLLSSPPDPPPVALLPLLEFWDALGAALPCPSPPPTTLWGPPLPSTDAPPADTSFLLKLQQLFCGSPHGDVFIPTHQVLFSPSSVQLPPKPIPLLPHPTSFFPEKALAADHNPPTDCSTKAPEIGEYTMGPGGPTIASSPHAHLLGPTSGKGDALHSLLLHAAGAPSLYPLHGGPTFIGDRSMPTPPLPQNPALTPVRFR